MRQFTFERAGCRLVYFSVKLVSSWTYYHSIGDVAVENSTFQLKPFCQYSSGTIFVFAQHNKPHTISCRSEFEVNSVRCFRCAPLIVCDGGDCTKRIGFACSFLCLACGVSFMERKKQIRQCKNRQTAYKAKRYKIHSALCSNGRYFALYTRKHAHIHMRKNILTKYVYHATCARIVVYVRSVARAKYTHLISTYTNVSNGY